MKTCLTDLEVVPSEVTHRWQFDELLRRHRDESSTEKVSLHRGKFEFLGGVLNTFTFGSSIKNKVKKIAGYNKW